jgi:hypothetical protein
MGLKRKDITPEMFEDVCEEFATTLKGLETIVKKFGINRNTFMRYYESDKEKLNRYTRARTEKIDYVASMMLEYICEMEELIKGNTYNDVNINAAVNILRIKIDAIKWLLSKLAPKEYGDKVAIEHEGNVNHVVTGMKIV